MEVYCLRHRKTGKFMPAQLFRNARVGASHWNPEDRTVYPFCPAPRIFYTKLGASCARSAWSKGVWTKNDAGGTRKPTNTERSLEDLELVHAQLILI